MGECEGSRVGCVGWRRYPSWWKVVFQHGNFLIVFTTTTTTTFAVSNLNLISVSKLPVFIINKKEHNKLSERAPTSLKRKKTTRKLDYRKFIANPPPPCVTTRTCAVLSFALVQQKWRPTCGVSDFSLDHNLKCLRKYLVNGVSLFYKDNARENYSKA